MNHVNRIIAIILLLSCAVQMQASVANLVDEVAELLLRGRRAVATDVLQARRLASEVETAAGPGGLRLVKEAEAAGLPAVEAAQCLISHPRLGDHGLDGLRTARQIGGGPALRLATAAPESLSTAARDPQTAQRWYRLMDHPDAARLSTADRQAIAARVARDPSVLDQVLRNAPTVGLGAALLATGIGVSIAAANAPLAIGGGIGLGILLLAGMIACWLWWRLVVPARRRAATTAATAALLISACGSPAYAESTNALLIRLEGEDRAAVQALAAGLDVDVDAKADQRAARSAAGAPSELLRTEPARNAADALRRLAMDWVLRTSELDDGVRSRHQQLLLALPYALAERLPSPPCPPPSAIADQLVLPSDRTLADGDRLRLAATVVALSSPLPLAVDVSLGVATDEAIARSIATPLSEARIAAAELAGGRASGAFLAIHARRIAQWHEQRRAGLRAALVE